MRRRSGLAFVIALWLLLMVPWTGLSVVLGAGTANCSEAGAHNRWLAEQSLTTTGQRHGTQGTFENYALQQCSSSLISIEISGSFVFVNIHPNPAASNDILQIGAGACRSPVLCGFGGMHYYTGMGLDHNTGGCSGYQDVIPVPVDEGTWVAASHQYRVRHLSNVWRFYVDAVQEGVDLAESAVCWTPRRSSWFGESWDFGDQIGGTATNHLSISNTWYTSTEGGAWVATTFDPGSPCNYVASSAPFFCDVTGAQQLDIWTAR